MVRHFITGLALIIASPLLAKTVTSATKLVDSNGDRRIVISKAVNAPASEKGATVFDCSKAAPFVYAVGRAENCQSPVEAVNAFSSRADTLLGINGVTSLSNCRPLRSFGAYRVIETYSTSTYRNITCSGLVGKGIKREGIRLRGTVENVTIENFKLIHEDKPNAFPHLPEGIHVEAGKNITIRNGEAAGFRMIVSTGKYTNGDAFATEQAVKGITFQDTTGRDSSDGCYDLKSYDTVMINTTALRCARNYRLWSTGTGQLMTSIDAGKWHVGLYGSQMKWKIKKLVVRSTTTAAIFHGERLNTGDTSLIVDNCDIQVPSGTKLFEGTRPKVLILGSGCVLP